MAATDKAHRVVITGLGVVASNGNTVEEFWSSLKAGRSGLVALQGVGPDHLQHCVMTPVAGHISGFDQRARLAGLMRDKSLPHAERFTWIAAAAADEAVRQSGLSLPAERPRRVAVIVGSALGGQSTTETGFRDLHLRHMKATHPLVLVRSLASSPAAHLGIEYGAKGPVFGICSACASADHAIAIGRDYVRNDIVDIAIVGGTESALAYGILLAMQSLQVLTRDACRPFSANRTGTVLAEGAGILVLEQEAHARARGAEVLAELVGAGLTAGSCDPPVPDPEAAAHAMSDALADAHLATNQIDYLNAFGVGTRKSDRCEIQAIKSAFPAHHARMSISSTKSMHGYAMGATGALEAVACIKAIQDGFVPPTIGLEVADPECDLDFTPNKGRIRDVQYAMSLTMALGGLNTALIFGPPPTS